MPRFNKFPRTPELTGGETVAGEIIDAADSLDPSSIRTDVLRCDGSVYQKTTYPNLDAALIEQYVYEGVTAFTGDPPANINAGIFYVANKTAYVAWDESADQIHASADGIAWIDTTDTLAGATFNTANDDYMAVADDGVGRTVLIFGAVSRFSDSGDLSVWSAGGALPFTYTKCKLIWDGAQFVATVWRTATGATVNVLTSTDGTSWSAETVTSPGSTVAGHQSVFFNSLYITVLNRSSESTLEVFSTATAGSAMTLQQTITPAIPPEGWWMGVLGGVLFMVVTEEVESRGIVYKSTDGTTWTEFLDIPEFFNEVNLTDSILGYDLAIYDSTFLTAPTCSEHCAIFNVNGIIRRITSTGETNIIADGSKSLLSTGEGSDGGADLGNMILIGDPASTLRVPDLEVEDFTTGDFKIPYIVTGD